MKASKLTHISAFILTPFILCCATHLHAHSAMYPDAYKYSDEGEGETTKTAIANLQRTKTQLRTETACIDGTADGFPCLHINLQSFVSSRELGLGSSSNLSDIWGWTDITTGREYAIVTQALGTAFVDVSDALDPVVVGFLQGQAPNTFEPWRDVKVYNDHAFIVADGFDNASHGLQIFDLRTLRDVTEIPTEFSPTHHFSGFGAAHNIAINEDSGFAYVVGSNMCSGGLYMMDVSNPADVSFEGCFSSDGYTHDAQCVIYEGPDNRFSQNEICLAFNEDSLTIVDVSNKANPTMLARATYPQVQYTHQGWMFDDTHSQVILNDELDELFNERPTTSYVFDISSLTAPSRLPSYTSYVGAIDHNLYTLDGFVFESNYRSGLRVLRVDNINTGDIVEVGYFDTIPGSNAPEFSGTWSSYVYFPSGNIVTSDIGNGLFVLKPDLDTMRTYEPPPRQSQSSSGGGGSTGYFIFSLIALTLYRRKRAACNARKP